jgi:hypothetical protein
LVHHFPKYVSVRLEPQAAFKSSTFQYVRDRKGLINEGTFI